MGTKENPGRFDCYRSALPDEPMFVLLARDHAASYLVAKWAEIRTNSGAVPTASPAKIREAQACSEAMDRWRTPENLARVEASKRKVPRFEVDDAARNLPGWNLGYEAGYQNGESSMQADFDIALGDVLPFDFDGPMDLSRQLAAIIPSFDSSAAPPTMGERIKTTLEALRHPRDGWGNAECVGARDAVTAAALIDELVAALTKCAAYSDNGGNRYFEATGSYGRFDEPAAARIAREVLEK